MVTTYRLCAACGGAHIRRNGSSQGHAKYQSAVARALRYAQVEQLLVERNSQRSIVRVTGVARMTVAKLLKKGAGRQPALASPAAEKGPTPGMGGARTR